MEVMIGIDPHKASHTAVAVDAGERVIGTKRLRASSLQVDELRRWAELFPERTWAIESARGLGHALSQQLVAAGEAVVDVPAVLSSRTRLLGSGKSQKNDPNDALSVAVAALRHAQLRRVRLTSHTDVLKVMAKRHRDVSRLRNQAISRLHATLLDLVPGGVPRPMRLSDAKNLVSCIDATSDVIRLRVELARELIDDITRYDSQIVHSKRRLQLLVAASGTTLTSIVGVGPVTAALMIGHTGDVSRFPTAGHYAAYNGTAPIEASSGDRRRHRLNPRGNRQLNYALHVVAIVQLRGSGPGREYYDRKIAGGKSHKEALRALKRQLSNVVHRALVADARNVSS